MLNLDLHNHRFEVLLRDLEEGVVFTPNVDHLMQLQRDQAFYQLYQQADHRLCDSRILLLTAKWIGAGQFHDQIAGSDFFPAYCRAHAKRIRVFLLGGSTPEIAMSAKQQLNAAAGHEVVVEAFSPPFGFEGDDDMQAQILTRIQESGADVLAVGLGAPKQEQWIMANRAALPGIRLFFAVGKTIDFLSGATKRAPVWMTRVGLEWAFRLLQEPRRLARRYLLEDLPFFALAWQQKQGRYRDPWRH